MSSKASGFPGRVGVRGEWKRGTRTGLRCLAPGGMAWAGEDVWRSLFRPRQTRSSVVT